MERASDNAFIGIAKRLLDAIGSQPPLALIPYNITAAELLDFNAKATAFITGAGAPRHAEAESMRGTTQLAGLISEMTLLLTDRLDPAAELLSGNQPNFFAEFVASREILDPSYNTRALQVVVTDSETGLPIQGANAVINPGSINKTTTALGGFYVGTLAPASNYTMALTHAGYTALNQPFAIVAGVMTDLQVQMEPVDNA